MAIFAAIATQPARGGPSFAASSRRRSTTRAASIRQANFIRLAVDKMKVNLRTGQTLSDPITFTVVFSGGLRPFVSWDVGDAKEDTQFGANNRNCRCKWDTPGEHTVEACLYDLDDPDFANAPHALSVSSKNVVTVTDPSADELAVKLLPNGVMSGTFIHPVTAKKTPFTGVVQQKLNRAGGVFAGPASAGSVLLTPQ